jgi:hypothetical protein
VCPLRSTLYPSPAAISVSEASNCLIGLIAASACSLVAFCLKPKGEKPDANSSVWNIFASLIPAVLAIVRPAVDVGVPPLSKTFARAAVANIARPTGPVAKANAFEPAAANVLPTALAPLAIAEPTFAAPAAKVPPIVAPPAAAPPAAPPPQQHPPQQHPPQQSQQRLLLHRQVTLFLTPP